MGPIIQWRRGITGQLFFTPVQNLLKSALLGFEVRAKVIFSQSGDDCPVIFCPLIPQQLGEPHCILYLTDFCSIHILFHSFNFNLMKKFINNVTETNVMRATLVLNNNEVDFKHHARRGC